MQLKKGSPFPSADSVNVQPAHHKAFHAVCTTYKENEQQSWLSLQEAGPSETDVSSLRTIEQRQWELQQQENAYWHEMLVSGYQSRTYQMVRGRNAGTSLDGGGAWWASLVVGQHRPNGSGSEFWAVTSAGLGLLVLHRHHRHCSCGICHLQTSRGHSKLYMS